MKRLAMTVALALVPVVAAADSQAVTKTADDGYAANSRITGTLGLFSPIGSLGIEYAHAVHPNAELALGFGYGFSGPQAAIMPRLRTGSGPVSVSLGVGVSGGPLVLPEFCLWSDYCGEDTKTTALWANAELGVQVASRSGTTFRLFAGTGRVVAHGECGGDQCGDVAGLMLPYGGVSFGHTL